MVRKTLQILFVVAVVTSFTQHVLQAGAGDAKGRHKRIYAVPAPEKVNIDGNLNEWDLSSQIHIYVSQATSKMRSAYYAMMYDEEALYIGAKVHDQSPMMNRHDPDVEPHKAWDADVCQIFMSLDASMDYPIEMSTWDDDVDERLLTMLLWYYTDEKQPNLAFYKGMKFKNPLRPELSKKGVVPGDKFKAAYQKFDNEKGYYFEYKIPWKTLEKDGPPSADEFLAGTVCVFWSGPQGMATAKGPAWAYDVMRNPGFPYQTAGCWGKIIFSEEGDIPRQLVEKGTPVEKPYPLTFKYDQPEDGYVTVGLYDESGRLVKNITVNKRRNAGEVTEQWTGRTLQEDPVEPGTYEWRGIYHDKINTEFITSVHNSGTPPYKTDDGTGGWGGDHGTPQTAARLNEDMLLAWDVAESGWGVIRVDADGDKKWGLKNGAEYLAGADDRFFAAGGHADPGVRVYDAEDRRPLNFESGENRANLPEGGSKKTNRVSGLDYHGEKLYVAYRERDLIAVNHPQSGELLKTWDVPAPGRLVALAKNNLLVVSEGKILRGENGDFETFTSTNLDEPYGIAADENKRIYVTTAGQQQNVRVFSPEGEHVEDIGKEGGRPRIGRYDPSGMLEPRGCVIGPKGRLWVAETLDGPKRVSVWNTETGENVDEFFGGSAYSAFAWMDPEHPDEVYCHNVLWKVDLDKESKRPWSTLWRPKGPNSPPAPMKSFQYKLRVLTAENGHQYAWGKMNHAHPSYLFIRRDDRFVPLLGFIQVSEGSPFVPYPPYPLMKDSEKYPNGTYLWVDENSDQRVQEKEVTSIDGKYTFQWMDKELNLYSSRGLIHRPEKIREDGTPVYDFRDPEKVSIEGSGVWVDPNDGSLYTKMHRWTSDGERMWGVPGSSVTWKNCLSRPGPYPGDLWGLTCPLGVAGNFTGAATYFGHMHILTRDGIYVDMIMDPPPGQKLGPQNLMCELFSGQLVKPEGMDRYFLLGGDQDGRIMEVHGLDTVKYLDGGQYKITESMAEQTRKAWEEYRQKKSQKEGIVISRGGHSGLDEADGIRVQAGKNRSFKAKITYDAENLYVRYRINSPHGLTNSVTDPKTIFTGGNCLDIMLASDPDAPEDRKKAARGDLRLLITRQEGAPKAVLIRPEAKDFDGDPIVLESPVDEISIDSIEVVDKEIDLRYADKSKGFSATVAIPLDLINWTPEAGSKVHMDLGYIYGNKSGSNALKRAYWSDNSFEANVIDDVPDEARLRPHEWGTAVVE